MKGENVSNFCPEKPETIKMVEQAMRVLNFLCAEKAPLGVNNIANRCSLNPSTCYRILKTLEKTGWVHQLGDNLYIPGQNVCFVTEKDNFYLALCDVSKLVMEQYTAKHGIAMNLIVRKGADCTIIQQTLPNTLANYVPPLHSTLPYYACGGGKVLLCELPGSLLEEILHTRKIENFTPYTVKNEEELRLELKKTADRGYAIDFQESSLNGSCVAVPVRDNEEIIVASLSFSGFVGLKKPDKLQQLVPALQEASERLTKRLYKSWINKQSTDYAT